jgi:thiol:disulfide interchange protein DsbD
VTRILALLALAAAVAPAAAATLGDDLATSEDRLLPADEAFILGVERQADSTIVLHWTIAEGYYLYRDRTRLRLEGAGEADLGEPRHAPARMKQDPFFGEMAVYYDEADLRVPLLGTPAPGATLHVTYQGCNEPVGVCYPPVEKSVALSALAPAGTGAAPGAGSGMDGRLASAVATGGTPGILLAFAGAGLLLLAAPPALPLAGMLAGVLAGPGGRGPGRGAARRTLLLVAAFAVGLGVFGSALALPPVSAATWLQRPVASATLAAILALLALTWLDACRRRPWLDARYLGKASSAGALGAVTALAVAALLAPHLVATARFMAEIGNPAIGALALLALGLGLGAPLGVAGALAGPSLASAVRARTALRAAGAIVLLAAGIALLQPLLPPAVDMALWAALLLAIGGALLRLASGRGIRRHGVRAAGAVLLVYGAVVIVGALGGGRSALQPLHGVLHGQPAAAPDFRLIEGATGLRSALGEARAAGRAVVVDVHADWCVACKRLQATTFVDAAVRRAFGEAMLLRADVTDNDGGDRALLQRFDLYGPPAVLFFGVDGIERRGHRVTGFMPPDPFAERVRDALKGATS